MTKLMLATFNKNKAKELKARLRSFKGVKVCNMEDLKGDLPMLIEDGKTFRQNAVKKAVTVSRYFDGLVLADDSGLEVEALHGKPGVRSARFARKNATDSENNTKLVKLMSKIPDGKRSARFVCILALAKKGRLLSTFEGKVSGIITTKNKGRNGFGYDPLFIPVNHEKTFAEMTPAYKNRISHRSQAMAQLKRSIQKYL